MVSRSSVSSPADIERAYSGSRVAWGAILAGVVVSIATLAILALIGLAIGFSIVEVGEDAPMNGALTTTGIWQFVAQIVALGVGGYVAARLAGLLPKGAAILHGAVVWGLATIVAIWIATSAVGALFSGATTAVTGALSGMGTTAKALIPDDFSLPDSLQNLSMDDLPEPLRRALEEQGVTPDAFQRETEEAFRAVISPQEQQQIEGQAQQSLQGAIANPANADEEAQRFISQVFGSGGVLGDEDRQQALIQMQQRFGISEAEANQFLDRTQQRAEELKQKAEQAVEEVRATAIEAADKAADIAAATAWTTALASVLGLLAALGGATLGRVKRV